MRSPSLFLRVVLVAASLSALSAAVVPTPSGAWIDGVQESEPGETGTSGTVGEEEFDGRSTEDTVRLVVGALVGIAVVTTVMMLVFVWHTSPRRRLRVATRRAERDRERPRVSVGDYGEGVTLDELLGERDDADPADWGDLGDAGMELRDLAVGETEDAEIGEPRE